jgi:hypothetical protein
LFEGVTKAEAAAMRRAKRKKERIVVLLLTRNEMEYDDLTSTTDVLVVLAR